MAKSRTPAPAWPHLLALLLPVVRACRQKRTGDRLLTLTVGLIQTLGRHTISQVLVELGRGQRDWSAAYRLFRHRRVRLDVARAGLLAAVLGELPPGDPLVVVLDATQLARTSPRFPGVSWLKAPRTPPWKPGIHRAQRWVGLSALLPRSPAGDSRTVPLWFAPAPAPKSAPWPGHPPCREWEAGLRALTWVRGAVDGAGRSGRRVLAVADGAYSIAPLWRALPPGVTLLARCAKNRALFALPAPRPTPTRGQRRRYGERGPTPHERLHLRSGWRTYPVRVRGRTIPLRVQISGPWLVKPAPHQPLFLLVVRGIEQRRRGRLIQRDPAYHLVSAVRQHDRWVVPYPVAELLAWAWQRWEVEVMHRELKSGFGLGQQQAWTAEGAATVVPWVVWTYGCLLLTGYRAWGWATGPPAARWQRRRRWTARDVAAAVRAELWSATGAPIRPVWLAITGNPAALPPPRWPITTPALLARRI